jgi:toxin ParE1/3/4
LRVGPRQILIPKPTFGPSTPNRCARHLANAAVQDLTDVWTYTQRAWSTKRADVYYRALIKSVHHIQQRPLIGRSYTEIWADLRGLPSGSHLILYRILPHDILEITRFVHQRVDLSQLKPGGS